MIFRQKDIDRIFDLAAQRVSDCLETREQLTSYRALVPAAVCGCVSCMKVGTAGCKAAGDSCSPKATVLLCHWPKALCSTTLPQRHCTTDYCSVRTAIRFVLADFRRITAVSHYRLSQRRSQRDSHVDLAAYLSMTWRCLRTSSTCPGNNLGLQIECAISGGVAGKYERNSSSFLNKSCGLFIFGSLVHAVHMSLRSILS